MKIQIYTLDKVIALFLISILAIVCSKASAQQTSPGNFPFFRSFLDNNLQYITFPPGNNNRNNAAQLDKVNNRGLFLTSGKEEVGAFILPDHTFSTEDGLTIEFEYVMIGNDDLTDGICMFLIDAQDKYINDMGFGAPGAGFGYTHRLAFDSKNQIIGIKGGYLAVALDQGPFKTIRMEGNEMRNGIIYNDKSDYSTSAQLTKYNTRSNITIRGAAGNKDQSVVTPSRNLNLKEALWGYPVLITRHTGWPSHAENTGLSELRNDAGFKLNTSNGMFIKDASPSISEDFNISGGKDFNSATEPEYRKAIIALMPNPNTIEGGFKITVTIQHGEKKDVVIKDFTYPSTLKYIENGVPRDWISGEPQVIASPDIIGYTVDRPQKLVIGFAGSTGWNNSYINIIKNLRITPLYAANTVNDDIVEHRRGPVTIRPLDNDIAYDSRSGPATGNRENIDSDSFRFWTDEYTCLGDNIYEHIVPYKGRWVYNPSMAEALFFPVEGFAGEVSIMYDVKGRFDPYDEEKFRSSLATISITIADNQPEP